eukprot:TRINITY_DN15038_c0_g1_i11.p1 TRINITY_DN15038_c0_g1~~TRINITY_DN15038_c0_g1_i11.p1  ORF type:complete len:203 (+),score=55.04 TRINITY_DN15038_c0_g1_i11:369-977(+)
MDYNTVSNALSSALNNLGNRGNVGIGSDPLVEEAMRLSLQTSQQEERKYEELENQLVSRGLKILTVPNDGNCLFHAVALQELGSIEFHSDLRANVISFMRNNKDRFVHFVTSNWENYLATMSCNGEYGTNLEIQTLSEFFGKPIEIYSDESGAEPMNTFQGDYYFESPIRLSYHRGNHYNAVVPITTEEFVIPPFGFAKFRR